MIDYHGNLKGVLHFPRMTSSAFAKAYNEVAQSVDKCPTASIIHPLLNVGGVMNYEKLPDGSFDPLNDCFIFYETKPQQGSVTAMMTTAQVKKELRLDL